MARVSPAEKLKRITTAIRAWETHARRSVFSSLSLDQFKLAMQPSLDSHAKVKELQQQLRVAIVQRDAIDARNLETLYRLGYAVVGDPAHGRNSALYKALGYTPEAVRRRRIRSGRRRTIANRAQ
jgi:hypothetical protein